MKQLPLPAHPVFPSRLDSLAALPELLRSRQIGCVLVIGDAHAVDCESLLLPVLEDSQIMYAVHAAVSLSDSKDGALTRTDVDTALQAFTDKQAQAILPSAAMTQWRWVRRCWRVCTQRTCRNIRAVARDSADSPASSGGCIRCIRRNR